MNSPDAKSDDGVVLWLTVGVDEFHPPSTKRDDVLDSCRFRLAEGRSKLVVKPPSSSSSEVRLFSEGLRVIEISRGTSGRFRLLTVCTTCHENSHQW